MLKIDTNEYRIRFLEKHINKANYNKSDEVINKCIDLAYTDMMSGGKSVGINNKEEKIEKFKKILKDHVYVFSIDLINETSENIFGSTIEFTNKKGKVVKATGFGLAQKLVNMTFKYLFTYYNYIKSAIQIDFSECHCPLDSNILNKLTNFKSLNWTQLNEDNYNNIQTEISSLLNEEKYKNAKNNLNCGNMVFDFVEFFNDEDTIQSTATKILTEHKKSFKELAK